MKNFSLLFAVFLLSKMVMGMPKSLDYADLESVKDLNMVDSMLNGTYQLIGLYLSYIYI